MKSVTIFALPILGQGSETILEIMKRNEKDFPTLSTQAPQQAWFPQAHVFR
jgi:hypothetical protein